MLSCVRLFEQLARRAASRAACTAGKSSATSTPMIAITTSSSTRVNPRRFMGRSPENWYLLLGFDLRVKSITFAAQRPAGSDDRDSELRRLLAALFPAR